MLSYPEKIQARLNDSAFQESVVEFLTALCAIDTTPCADVKHMQSQEALAFDVIEKFLASNANEEAVPLTTERRSISPDIANNPAFSKLHFTKTNERPDGLSPTETYANRSNLLAFLDGKPNTTGHNTALNAHVDVIAPFIPPHRDGDTLFGRGTIDDKGNVVAICAALRILQELAAADEIELKNKITAMFPVEEETGGNGSLALALDCELRKRYDSIMVLECTDGKIHPGNRGAVWFKLNLKTWSRQSPAVPPVSLEPAVSCRNHPQQLPQGTAGSTAPALLYAATDAILAMADEGAKIKGESDHPLFPHRPVQTCNGILGPFGEHPSRINGYIKVRLKAATGLAPVEPAISTRAVSNTDPARHVPPIHGWRKQLRKILNQSLADYIAARGDKTRVTDPDTGKPKVAHHYDLTENSDGTFTLEVYGATGHMGSILDNDDAILKWAYLTRALDESELEMEMSINDFDTTTELVVEGGQGFLPTHPIKEIQDRMREAAICGVRNYLDRHGMKPEAVMAEVTYDKLHNNAFAGDSDSTTMQNAQRAGVESGVLAADSPVRGWDVSCDARLFATEHPDIPVLTTGVGLLAAAHSDTEHLNIPELWPMIEFITRFLVYETGSEIQQGI